MAEANAKPQDHPVSDHGRGKYRPDHLAETGPANPVEELQEFLRAVHLMKLYASAQGIVIPEAVRSSLSNLAAIEMVAAEIDKAEIVSSLAGFDLETALGYAMEAHSLMSEIVAPATPDSIAYTQPPAGFADFWRRQRILAFLLIVSFFAITGFISCVIWKTHLQDGSDRLRDVLGQVSGFEGRLTEAEKLPIEADNLADQITKIVDDLERRGDQIRTAAAASHLPAWPQDEITLALDDMGARPTGSPGAISRIRAQTAEFRQFLGTVKTKSWWEAVCDQLTNLLAAMLGAAFYTLYTANRYIVDRTFDRAYTIHYIVRFVLGIVAGVILANFGEYLLSSANATTPANAQTDKPPSEIAIVLMQTMLALVGGYSADAVNAIFTRVAETLTTLVQGDAGQRVREEAKAEVTKAEAKARQKEEEAKVEILKVEAAAKIAAQDATRALREAQLKERAALEASIGDALQRQLPADFIEALRRRLLELGQEQ